jgi:putative oxidoreductase
VAAHGSQKLFGWFGGYGIAGTGGFLESLGFRPGCTQALVAGLAEFGGGLLLALGLATPVAAALILSVMVTALVSVHLPKGFFITSGGLEYVLVIGAAALAIAFAGPGVYSVDWVEGLASSGWKPGLGALIAGLVFSGGALVTRRPPATAPTA